MNRTIKYRGYSKASKKWVYGYLVIDRDDVYCIFYYDSLNNLHEIVVEPESIGQFIGLRDCNGKEIYEGDIVRFVGGTCNMLPCSPYQHEWHKKGTILVCRMLDSGWALSPKSILKYQEPNIVGNVQNYDFWNHQRSLEVIGNIYENPEFIETI